VRYDNAFMFKYSRREHTKAFNWDETVSDGEKSRRLQAVIALEEQIAAAINQVSIGATAEVLVEGPARRRDRWLAGKNPQFKTVVFPAGEVAVGETVPVRVTATTAHTLVGEIAPRI